MENFSPHAFLEHLELSSVFIRGLPPDNVLQERAVAHVLSNVLRTGSITQFPAATEEATALDQCYHNGWLHADKVRTARRREETVYALPSQLHRWFVEWKLFNSVPSIPLDNTILELVIKVIGGFSPTLLSAEQRIGPGCIQRPPEAQYQDEFYRCCHAYSKGQLKTFPEFGVTKGRVDFYIPSMRWGVELVRDGDQLQQDYGRFSRSGLYETTLPLADYIVLDFRNTQPESPHSSMCIICPSIHFPSFRANLTHRYSRTVPRCLQQ
jgi:hypothetical protein